MHPTAQASDEGLVPLAAADLQDHLMVAQNDLNRLQRLLGDACDTLLRHFYGASPKPLPMTPARRPLARRHSFTRPWNTWPRSSPPCSSTTWLRS
jgi:hypothetical protein